MINMSQKNPNHSIISNINSSLLMIWYDMVLFPTKTKGWQRCNLDKWGHSTAMKKNDGDNGWIQLGTGVGAGWFDWNAFIASITALKEWQLNCIGEFNQ